MRHYALIGLIGMGIAAGCQSGSQSTSQVNPPIDENSPSIAEADVPTIQSTTYIAAGDLAASRGNLRQAADQYEKAIGVNPGDATTIKKLALTYMRADRVPEGLNTWLRYKRVSNDSADAYGSLGYAYELAGRPDDAEKTYIEGTQKHPKGTLVQINYGLMLVRKNRVDEALTHLSMVLQPHEVNYNVASVYEQVGRRDLAQFYYRRALECNPAFTPAKQRLAAVE